MTPVQLPEVPAPIGHLHSDDDFCRTVPVYPELWPVDVYTAAQLREYATAAVLADRERVAALAGYYRELEKLSDTTPSETNSER